MFKSVDIIVAELLGNRHTPTDKTAVQRLYDLYGHDGDIASSEGRHANAIPSYQKHLEINPHDFERNLALSTSYFQLYCLPEAEAACDTALALRTHDAEAHIQRSIIRFARGNWRGALSDMEYRRDPHWAKSVNWSSTPRDVSALLGFTATESDRDEPLLVTAEGGAGDTFQFAAFLKALSPYASRIVFEVQDHLLSLMKGLEDASLTVIGRKQALPFPVTRHVRLLSLPYILGINPLAQNPWSQAYELPLNAEKLAAMKDQLDRELGPHPRVGIAWRSDPNNKFDLGRDIPIELMRPLTEQAGITCLCLLDDASAEERAALPSLKYLNKVGERVSFEDMALAMKCLDLVISIDTAWPNLAGALRVPTLLMLRHVPNWRWGLDGETTPLAPTTRLLRQAESGNWREPVQHALAALKQLQPAP